MFQTNPIISNALIIMKMYFLFLIKSTILPFSKKIDFTYSQIDIKLYSSLGYFCLYFHRLLFWILLFLFLKCFCKSIDALTSLSLQFSYCYLQKNMDTFFEIPIRSSVLHNPTFSCQGNKDFN